MPTPPVPPAEALARLADCFTAVNDRLKDLNRATEDYVDTIVALAKGKDEACVVAYEAALEKAGRAEDEEAFDAATEEAGKLFVAVKAQAQLADPSLVAQYVAAVGEIESILTTYEQVAERINEVCS